MSGEFTLVEMSKVETDMLRKSVIDIFLMEAIIMQLIPWETIGALSTKVVRMGTLPSVGFRKVNEGYTGSQGSLEQKTEHIALMGGNFDTDKAIARAKNTIAAARAITQVMMTKSMAYKFNDKYINGNPDTDSEEFKGIKQRVDDVYAEGYTGQKIDFQCNGVGFLNSSAVSHDFLNNMDKMMYQVRGHNPQIIHMCSTTLLAIRSLLRKERLLDTTKDMFDRTIDMYGSAWLSDIGVKADQTSEIITTTETADGSATTGGESSSMFAVQFGIGEKLWGIQEYPMEVEDLGRLEDKPVYRTELDWPLGLAQVDPYCIVRGHDIIPNSSS
jgi:hypothetical protein